MRGARNASIADEHSEYESPTINVKSFASIFLEKMHKNVD
jgi:hypothetical protein